MRRAWLAVIASASAGLACSDTPYLFISAPQAADSGAIVAALIDPARTRLFGFEPDEPIELPYPSNEELARVELLYYDETLAELELDRGPITLAFPNEPSHSLAPPKERWVHTLDDSAEWVRETGLSAALENVRLAGAPPSACDELEPHVISLDSLSRGEGGMVAETLPDGRVLMSYSSTTAFVIAQDESISFLDYEPPTRFSLNTAELDEDGTLWLGSSRVGHVVVHGRIEGNRLEILAGFPGPRSDQARFMAVTGHAANGNATLFIAHKSGLVTYFDGSATSTAGQLYRQNTPVGGLVRRGPDEVYAAWNGELGLLVINPQGIEPLPVDGLSENEALTTVARDVDDSLLAADVRGTLYRISDERTAVPLQSATPELLNFSKIFPYEGGFIAGGSKGTLILYSASGELCSLGFPTLNGAVNDIAAFGDGFILAVDVGDEEIPRIIYFTKKPD